MASVFLLLALCLRLASAQDPVVVNPRIVKVEFENEQVRILRVRYGPHEQLAMHSHPQRAVVLLTDRQAWERKADGHYHEGQGRAGQFVWADAVTHTVGNLIDEPAEAIEIEMKKATDPSIPVACQQATKAALKEPVPVQQEPHHHCKFENQYARVLEVELAPDESTLVHTHSHDGIAVYLSDATVQEQELGKRWAAPSAVRQGQVDPPEGEEAKLPNTRRVKNVGATAFHVIFIELLR